MQRFQIRANKYLCRDITGFYHIRYVGFRKPGNPDYLNDLKNTFNNFSRCKLESAAKALLGVLQEDLPQVLRSLGLDMITVCVVPRAKSERSYEANQLLFRETVRYFIKNRNSFIDGTDYILRHTNTKTTHLSNTNISNDGPMPYPGITKETCTISPNIRGKNILLIDDIYTPGVNIDEDAINALLETGARTVSFYAVAKVR